jgi:hypothetical protein
MSVEKRLYPRYNVDRPGDLTVNGKTVKVRVTDVSLGGAGILGDEQVVAGSGCHIRIAFWFGDQPKHFDAACKAAYSTIAGMSGYRVGLVFTSVSPESRAVLTTFFHRRP